MDYTLQIQAVKDAQTQVDQRVLDALATDAANQEAQQALQGARGALLTATNTLNAAMAAGGTIASVSTVDQLLQKERFAGKSSCIDFVKAHPACTEAEAIAAWTIGGTSATGLASLLVPAQTYEAMFEKNLLAAGLIATPTWENLLSWMVATDKATIMDF